jgi:hypothetical protein
MSYIYRISFWILLLGTAITVISYWESLNRLMEGMGPTGRIIAVIAVIAAFVAVGLGLVVLDEMAEHHKRLEWRASQGLQD